MNGLSHKYSGYFNLIIPVKIIRNTTASSVNESGVTYMSHLHSFVDVLSKTTSSPSCGNALPDQLAVFEARLSAPAPLHVMVAAWAVRVRVKRDKKMINAKSVVFLAGDLFNITFSLCYS